jgi:hypothetical protein
VKAVTLIDRALKELYQLNSPFQAEHFLVTKPLAHKAGSGALYIAEPTGDDDTLGLGIYLDEAIQKELQSFPTWEDHWSPVQTSAFGVAAEEVSHFNYIVHHAPKGRSVSHLELELQGEIDKFLLVFFASPQPLEELFEKCFEKFQWHPGLSEEERARYEQANILAKAFLFKNAGLIGKVEARERCFRFLREFYRLSFEGKVSVARR